jgi:hypothetical protein
MNVPPPWTIEVVKDLNKVKSISVLVDSSSHIDLNLVSFNKILLEKGL